MACLWYIMCHRVLCQILYLFGSHTSTKFFESLLLNECRLQIITASKNHDPKQNKNPEHSGHFKETYEQKMSKMTSSFQNAYQIYDDHIMIHLIGVMAICLQRKSGNIQRKKLPKPNELENE